VVQIFYTTSVIDNALLLPAPYGIEANFLSTLACIIFQVWS